jgi:peptidoglycan/xylan/chitin deacetylase (PgdA/CDA1 family)
MHLRPTEPLAPNLDALLAWARRLALVAIFLGAAPVTTLGGEPSDAVIPHRGLWPDPVDSPAEFDRASRAEILVFAHALADSETLSDEALKSRLGLDAIDAASVQRVRHKLWKLLAANYVTAAAGCDVHEAFCPIDQGSGDLRHEAEAFTGAAIQPRYKLWFEDAARFQLTYLDELLRLAAVFPRTNSEVATLNDNESPGWGLPDRHFLLSFDDGPTRDTERQGPNARDTDLTLEMLRRNHVNGVFFAVGASFQARMQDSSVDAMRNLYSGMCVGSHGWLHESHATWSQWQDSVASSSKLVHDTLPDSWVPAFRPPYGQRRADSGPYFQDRGLKVMLWNIDSHDWDDGLTADQVEQRVMSLMLLWRRGFILFHDFFPRARMVVPRLVSWLAHDDVAWVDCHRINWSGRAADGLLSTAGKSAFARR